MTTKFPNRIHILLFTILLTFAGEMAAQSTNSSAPTPLKNSEFTAKGPSKETNYYYSLTGGPGEVAITLTIKAKQYSTFARLEVLDAESNTLATHNMNATTGSGPVQVTKKLGLSEKQTLILKLTLDGNLSDYKISTAGAVETSGSGADAGQQSEEGGNDLGGDVVSDPLPDVSAQTQKGKKFSIDYKTKLQQLKDLPTNGTLIIQMKDGTTQEFILRDVRNVTVRP